MQHTIYLGLGANLGDRQVNLARAIGRLRQSFQVEAVSPAYETEPVGYADQPDFINLVVRAGTDLSPQEALTQLKAIEHEMGRRRNIAQRYGPRPIDIDLLYYDSLCLADDEAGVRLPHPEAHHRAFVLVPMADLAPHFVHPELGQTILALRDGLSVAELAGVRRIDGGILAGFSHDVQNERPAVALGLERVGVTGIERVIHLASPNPVKLFYAELDLYVDLAADQKGAHMSRFPYLVDESLDELARRPAPGIESLAGWIAEALVERQAARRAEVAVRAKVPRTRYTPLSGQRTQDVFTLLGWAVSNGLQTARLVGVEVEGMTACPCAQDMMRDHARARLLESGFDAAAAERALAAVPLATHSQRSRGTLVVSAHERVQADDLVRIVEASMSSEIFELLKRPDEFFIVNQAHRNPKFVEDVVREMLGLVVDTYPELADDAFVLARQQNFESIHRHDVYAERGATMGDLRGELGGGPAGTAMRLERWLDEAVGV